MKPTDFLYAAIGIALIAIMVAAVAIETWRAR